jgi:hypothetical protein
MTALAIAGLVLIVLIYVIVNVIDAGRKLKSFEDYLNSLHRGEKK